MDVDTNAVASKDVGVQTDVSGEEVQKTLKQYKRKIKLLQQQVASRDKRIRNIGGMMQHLHDNKESNQSLQEVMMNNLKTFPVDIFTNELRNCNFAPTHR